MTTDTLKQTVQAVLHSIVTDMQRSRILEQIETATRCTIYRDDEWQRGRSLVNRVREAMVARDIHAQSPAMDAVGEERHRQRWVLGLMEDHDDQHTGSEIAKGAIAKALFAVGGTAIAPSYWPWRDSDMSRVFDGGPRTLYVQAAAMLIAEVERLDRAQQRADEAAKAQAVAEIAAALPPIVNDAPA